MRKQDFWLNFQDIYFWQKLSNTLELFKFKLNAICCHRNNVRVEIKRGNFVKFHFKPLYFVAVYTYRIALIYIYGVNCIQDFKIKYFYEYTAHWRQFRI